MTDTKVKKFTSKDYQQIKVEDLDEGYTILVTTTSGAGASNHCQYADTHWPSRTLRDATSAELVLDIYERGGYGFKVGVIDDEVTLSIDYLTKVWVLKEDLPEDVQK